MTPLEESIKHWERLASGNRAPHEDIGSKQCSLCRTYMHSLAFDQSCLACPVYEHTGRRYCGNTPYQLIDEIRNKMTSLTQHQFLDTEEFKEVAKKELEFLKSLLPKL